MFAWAGSVITQPSRVVIDEQVTTSTLTVTAADGVSTLVTFYRGE
jgi:hypothetical protein